MTSTLSFPVHERLIDYIEYLSELDNTNDSTFVQTQIQHMFEVLQSNPELLAQVHERVDGGMTSPLELLIEQEHYNELAEHLFRYATIPCTDQPHLDSLLFTAVINNAVELAALFIEAGADVNHRRNFSTGKNILLECIWGNYLDAPNRSMIDLLVRRGLNLNYQDSNGNTVLHCLIDSSNEYLEEAAFWVALLIELGADVSIKNNAEMTAMEFVEEEINYMNKRMTKSTNSKLLPHLQGLDEIRSHLLLPASHAAVV